ncbi:hypothetical protein ACFL1H_08255, partial [Nanoarchaeota archaeon]
MKKKVLIFVILFLLVLLPICAETLVYDNWIFNRDTIVANEQVYNIFFNEESESILVQTDLDYVKVDRTKCKRIDITQICYTEKEYDINQKADKIHIKVFRIEPTINIRRTMTYGQIVVGKEYEINVILSNTGDKKTRNLIYEDVFPDFIEITETSGCEAIGSTIRFNQNLNEGETEDFSYTIKPLEQFEQSFRASINFDTGYETIEEWSNTLNIDAKDSIQFDSKYSTEELWLGEEYYYNITLENILDEDDLDVQAYIFTPDSIEVKKTEELTKIDDNTYLFDKTIIKG